MIQTSLFSTQRHSWSVTELTRYLRDLLASDTNLQDAWVQGEVSNFSRPSSGHWYFTVKDNGAALKCVMWRNTAQRQTFTPRDGDAVEVHGAIGVYEVGGAYQLYADSVRPLGAGALYQEFLRLKERLEAQGLFDAGRKRPLPAWPQRIGVITSPTGAALRDMLNTLRRRYPLAEVVLIPTPVQGAEAPPGIVRAFQAMQEQVHPDVILLARGGGAIEDLWAFNDERVAHAIAASVAPVISGVGHETDFTIADFVADLRAPTPTAAAELATPDRNELYTALGDLTGRLAHAMQTSITAQRWQLNGIENRLRLHSPRIRLQTDRQRVDDLARRTASACLYALQRHRARLDSLGQRLAALSPLAVLARGFAVVTKADGNVVRQATQAQAGDRLTVRVSDGSFTVKVQEGKGQ
ncbi:MAG: exodeoxyribonuclease VII large subunit [Chloroflexota bacterium]